MNKLKRILLFSTIFALGIGVFYIINKKSNRNPNFEDKSAWKSHEEKLKFYETKMQNLSDEIKKNVGKGACEYDYECQVRGLGVKTCDGYSNYVIYSTKDANELELLNAIDEFNKANQEFNQLSMNVPSCGEKAKEPSCYDNRCTVARR